MSTHRRSDLPEIAPNQYGVGRRCMACPTVLSRYNRYTVCGPCRVRMSLMIPVNEVAFAKDVEDCGFVWERFPKREPVRRGPLLTDTVAEPE